MKLLIWGNISTEAKSNIHVHGYFFMVTPSLFYVCLCLFLCTNNAKEACLSIAGSKDASVVMLYLQLLFP